MWFYFSFLILALDLKDFRTIPNASKRYGSLLFFVRVSFLDDLFFFFSGCIYKHAVLLSPFRDHLTDLHSCCFFSINTTNAGFPSRLLLQFFAIFFLHSPPLKLPLLPWLQASSSRTDRSASTRNWSPLLETCCLPCPYGLISPRMNLLPFPPDDLIVFLI